MELFYAAGPKQNTRLKKLLPTPPDQPPLPALPPGKTRIHYGLEHLLDKILYNPARKRLQDWLERKNINYYLTAWLYRVLAKLFKIPRGTYTIYCIGQSHLDAAWKWTKFDTLRKALITFKHAVEHLEKYPFFTMSMSSPQYYAWVQQLRPALFAKVREHARTGRFEFVGGMWVEPDVNLISGESIVRQRLLGQRWYLEQFGQISRVAVLSDSFGFPVTLPQLLVKSGARYFWTNKIAWNDLNEFPLSTFYWQAPDGSRIFTHNFLFNVMGIPKWRQYGRLNRFPREPDAVFDAHTSPAEIERALTEEHLTTLGYFYGLGDGGAGPLEEEVLLLKNIARAGVFRFTNTYTYFQKLAREMQNPPTWNDELYLEFHRGCYTTIEMIKRLNRACERALYDTEVLASWGRVLVGQHYPRDALKRAWRMLCFNQFHDILPGSSIQEVYEDAERDLSRVLDTCASLQERATKNLLRCATGWKPTGTGDRVVVVLNTLAWARGRMVTLRAPHGQDLSDLDAILTLRDPTGRLLPFQRVLGGMLVDLGRDGALPAGSVTVLETNSQIFEEDPPESDLLVFDEEDRVVLENRHLRLAVSRRTGFVSSLHAKAQDRELLGRPGGGNEIRVYGDDPAKYPAWNIDTRYTRQQVPLGPPIHVKLVEEGALQATVEVMWSHERSYLTGRVSLRQASPAVHFTLDADWTTPLTMVKVHFTLCETLAAQNAVTCEIPFGTITRPLVPRSAFEKGKWEFPAQRWVDISDATGGVTLVDRSKYGYSTTPRGVAMTILRTPSYPDDPFFTTHRFIPKERRSKYSDIKQHHVEYALHVHAGTWTEGEAWRAGLEFNSPPIVVQFPARAIGGAESVPGVPLNGSMVSVSPTNVILAALKGPYAVLEREGTPESESESKTNLVLRVYEIAGTTCTARVEFPAPFHVQGVEEVDLLEFPLAEPAREISVAPHEITFPVHHHEVVTLRVTFA